MAYIVPVTAVAALSAHFTLSLFGESYAAVWPVYVVLLLAALPIAMDSLLSTLAMASNRSGLWLLSDLVQAAVLLSTATCLIPLAGGIGASLSYLLASMATCLTLVPVTRRMWVRS